MEGGSLSNYGSCLSAAYTRLKNSQAFHGLGTSRFQHVALALSPRTSVLQVCTSFAGRGKIMLLQP
eukprot:7110317-Pyramimonas_sp.AAC.1